MAVALICHYSV